MDGGVAGVGAEGAFTARLLLPSPSARPPLLLPSPAVQGGAGGGRGGGSLVWQSHSRAESCLPLTHPFTCVLSSKPRTAEIGGLTLTVQMGKLRPEKVQTPVEASQLDSDLVGVSNENQGHCGPWHIRLTSKGLDPGKELEGGFQSCPRGPGQPLPPLLTAQLRFCHSRSGCSWLPLNPRPLLPTHAAWPQMADP